jgi:hypothetical protein
MGNTYFIGLLDPIIVVTCYLSSDGGDIFIFRNVDQSSWRDPEARVRFPALQKKVVGLERGSLSLMSTTEELLDRKLAAPVKKTENTAVGIRHADHVALFIRKSWQSVRRQAAVARSV